MKTIMLAATAALAFASAAQAVTFSSTAGAPDPGPAAGQTILFDFNAATPALTGSYTLLTGSVSGAAAPAGDATQYAAVPIVGDGTPSSGMATLDLTGLPRQLHSLSLYWGSIDTYNTLDFYDGATKLFSLNGSMLPPANGDQGAGATNRRVYFDFHGANVTSLVFTSTSKAFEFDNIAGSYVPEPASWALMIVGFGLVGVAARRREIMRNVVA